MVHLTNIINLMGVIVQRDGVYSMTKWFYNENV